MTGCVGLNLDQGLVLLSGTRIKAGVDDISVFRKMLTWATPGKPVIMLIAAGNLTMTQAATSLLDERTQPPPGRKPSLREAPSMFQVAPGSR